MDAVKAEVLRWVQDNLGRGLADLEMTLGEATEHPFTISVEHQDIAKSETMLRVTGLPTGGNRYFHVKVKEMM